MTRDLGELLDHISALADEDFTLTDDKRRCRFCPTAPTVSAVSHPANGPNSPRMRPSLESPSWDQ